MATIYDVAARAGVSAKTVSRFLNGDGPVGKATRERVSAAVRELGYVPSSAARSMRSNRSRLVGLVTGAISASPARAEPAGLPDIEIVQGIQRALEGSGLTLMIADTGGVAARAGELVQTFLEHRAEGIFHVADHHQHIALPAAAAPPRTLLVNCFDDAGTPCVLPDDFEGQRLLTEGLIDRGHRRIGYLTLAASMPATRLRRAGYEHALAAAGLAADPALVVEADIPRNDPPTAERLLAQALDRVLALADPPTVLCFGNDRMAMRGYGMLRARGLSLPGDLSLAGYDNYELIAGALFPTLTSVVLPYAEMGRTAGRLLTGLIEDGTPLPAEPVLVRGPVVWRDSVLPGPCAG